MGPTGYRCLFCGKPLGDSWVTVGIAVRSEHNRLPGLKPLDLLEREWHVHRACVPVAPEGTT